MPEEDRNKVAEWLQKLTRSGYLLEILMNPEGVLTHQTQDWIFGETLPPGLALSGSPGIKTP